jgi:TRAP transporter 4TM/12TM fusion protein
MVYPLFADKFPGRFAGYPLTFSDMVGDFAFGSNGMLGLPAMMFGSLILGFYLFAGIIGGLGASEFFLQLSIALMGRFRGGPAKVSVLSSAFFGTLSGSIIANIVADGNYTIPAMKKMGFSPERAAAIEACASTGGPITPPILGGMAFTAAIIGGYDYSTIMIAAVIPAILYFTGLLVQVDAHAGKIGMKGLPREDIPSVWPILRNGWIYPVCILFLTFGLLYFRWGAITPIYAAFLMILLSFTSKRTRLSWKQVERALAQTSGLINFGVGIFLSMSLILVGLFKTGVAAAITAWVIGLGASNLYLILAIAALFDIAMGMVGLESSAFLFLSVTMAPAVAAIGNVPLVACHLFLICYSILGDVTPPVAIGAFIAASIAGANPMKTGWIAFRFAIVLFFMPFFFVLQPALILQGTPLEIIYHLIIALVGIFILASALEGYMAGLGKLSYWERSVAGIGGFLIAFPEYITTIVGIAMALLVVVTGYATKSIRKQRPTT